jgi:type VI secretion system protein ImpJ
MRNLPVQWSEGMFLRPQHFQAAERYWTELIQTSEKWDHHYNYGLRSIDISEEAIGNYQVDVAACQARLKDGTLVALGLGQEPDRVDLQEAVRQLEHATAPLKDAFEKEASLRVYLAVPTLKMGRANVRRDDPSGREEMEFEEEDEVESGEGIPSPLSGSQAEHPG